MSATGPSTAIQEILYGFIMALILVTATRVSSQPIQPTHFMLMVTGMIATWGAIDGIIFYFLGVCNQLRHFRLIRNDYGLDREARIQMMMDELSATPVDALDPEDQRAICESILDKRLEDVVAVKEDRRAMLMNSVGCFIWSILTLVPVLLPVILIDDFDTALIVSSSLSSIMLFFVGYYLALDIGTNRWLTGLVLTGVSWAITIVSTFTGG